MNTNEYLITDDGNNFKTTLFTQIYQCHMLTQTHQYF